MDADLNLDEEALAKIFMHENVRTVPVSIVSVAGPFRTGKSFLLNIFLKELKETCSSVSRLIHSQKVLQLFFHICVSVPICEVVIPVCTLSDMRAPFSVDKPVSQQNRNEFAYFWSSLCHDSVLFVIYLQLFSSFLRQHVSRYQSYILLRLKSQKSFFISEI